jgi:Asp-tRNA(Asn)/Glu-tRNA(Gln) amidotransferase A subunit family amidase
MADDGASCGSLVGRQLGPYTITDRVETDMPDVNEARRRFMAHFASIGLGTTLAPGILWARMQDAGGKKITLAMVTDAMKLSGLDFTEAELKAMVDSANQNLTRYEESRAVHIPNDVSPPFHFSAIVPGIEVNKTKLPFRLSAAPAVKRPANLEEAAFWPVRHLAELIRTRQVTSVELTEMYLARLHRYNAKLNNVVTFLDEHGLAEARRADAEIAAGKYKGPLHGIPWGAKDIISVKGYKTTWGSPAFKDQSFDYDASVVEMLRDAGAVLIAKVTTGELASGDQWFGGQTKNPWNLSQGSSGSSAGPSSATAAGCVGFGIGSETSGSILSPSARCGLAGLRPTFGRISRYGVMALSWTQDRLGPICRYAEDCAIVMHAIAKPDGRDMSVSDIPFNWNPQLDVKKLRVGYIKESFDELTNPAAKKNAEQTLETLRSIGVTRFIPLAVPDVPSGVQGLGVESLVFFDEHARAGRMKEARNGARPNGRLIPAVEYLRGQRIRMMMMMKLAEATAGLDVYVVASNNTGGGGGRGDGRGGGRGGGAAETTTGEPATTAPAEPPRPQTPTQRHSTMANLACYPAINVPNGFAENGSPTNVTLFARPFDEMELLALAKAYQDAAGFHLKRPTALDATTTSSVLL